MTATITCRLSDRSCGDRSLGQFQAVQGCVPRVGDLLVWVPPGHNRGMMPVSWKVDAVQWLIPSRVPMALDSCELLVVPAPGPFWRGREDWMPKDDDEEQP